MLSKDKRTKKDVRCITLKAEKEKQENSMCERGLRYGDDTRKGECGLELLIFCLRLVVGMIGLATLVDWRLLL